MIAEFDDGRRGNAEFDQRFAINIVQASTAAGVKGVGGRNQDLADVPIFIQLRCGSRRDFKSPPRTTAASACCSRSDTAHRCPTRPRIVGAKTPISVTTTLKKMSARLRKVSAADRKPPLRSRHEIPSCETRGGSLIAAQRLSALVWALVWTELQRHFNRDSC